ncbi:MAG TPA: penicillin-binding transpeptidase domain-containing protein [Phycisphaerae bacterium]|nr:penicillin-binding transpeptidase domain-containing protein [Phycisphaerae bacterium]
MLNRRLVVLFCVIVAAFLALSLRLGHMQVSQADQWRSELDTFVHRASLIETSRGTIYDRQGVAIARDVPCYDLAIDYRAIAMDDAWIKAVAQKRLAAEKVTGRDARARRLAELQDQIADQIDAEPAAIARVCRLTTEDVLARYNEIREKIATLKQNLWSHPYVKGNGNDDDQPTVNTDMVLKEEVSPHTIVPNIPDDVSFYFKRNIDQYPGLTIIDSRRREYRFNDVACQVIGTLRNVDADAFKKDPFDMPAVAGAADGSIHGGNLHGYLPGDLMGESGIEKLKEDVLRGDRGVKVKDIAADSATPDAERRIDPTPGGNVQLTLDIGLQADIQNAIREKHLLRGEDGKDHFAALVVMSLDGQVLTLWSSETYNLNQIDSLRGTLIRDDYRRPLTNRALQGYTPGSTVKPLVASAALSENVITPATTVVCNGYLFPGKPNIFRCAIYEETHGAQTHGPLQVVDALAESCNIFFYTVGRDMGMDRMVQWFDAYGLGRDSGFELPEQNGSIPDLHAQRDPDAALMESTQMGIGQGPITVTPIQMAAAYATLLQAGQPVRPHIIAEDTGGLPPRRINLAPETLALVRQGMDRVVASPEGTAYKPFKGIKLPIAGKTGSATAWGPVYDDNGNPVWDTSHPEKNPDGSPKIGPDGQPLYHQATAEGTHAWFVGYAPAGKPQYIVVAMMEFGGYGGSWAAPMAREAFLQLERHNYLPALDVPPPDPQAPPNAVGSAR